MKSERDIFVVFAKMRKKGQIISGCLQFAPVLWQSFVWNTSIFNYPKLPKKNVILCERDKINQNGWKSSHVSAIELIRTGVDHPLRRNWSKVVFAWPSVTGKLTDSHRFFQLIAHKLYKCKQFHLWV